MTTTSHRASSASIDPRIRARRVAVQRSAGRRRLRRLLVALGLLALVAAGYGVTRTALLDVDGIEVVGAERTDPGAVRVASGIEPGEPMTDLDLGSARRGIARLPWIDTVHVERRWPGTVRVEVTEREPLAVVTGPGGRAVVVDRTGRILEELGATGGPVPALTPVALDAPIDAVPGEHVPGLEAALALVGLLTGDLQPWVAVVRSGSEGTVLAELAGGVEVVFGPPVHLADKVIDLTTVLARVDLEDLATIDLRVPRTPVLTRATPAT